MIMALMHVRCVTGLPSTSLLRCRKVTVAVVIVGLLLTLSVLRVHRAATITKTSTVYGQTTMTAMPSDSGNTRHSLKKTRFKIDEKYKKPKYRLSTAGLNDSIPADDRNITPLNNYEGHTNFTQPTEDMLTDISMDRDIDWKINQLGVDPIPFLPTYKNPCWFESLPSAPMYRKNVYRVLLYNERSQRDSFKRSISGPMSQVFMQRRTAGLGWRLRCLPYFYIPGVSKCGTTDLFTALASHPDVAPPPLKEPVYWNRVRLDAPQHSIGWLPKVLPKIKHVPVPRPFRDYVDLYDNAAEAIRGSVIGQRSPQGGAVDYHHKITGDGTPSYLYDFDGWTKLDINKGLSEPKYTIADYIHNLTPQAKIIIILREPCERLFSDYKYFDRKSHKSIDDFHNRAKIAIGTMQECLAIRSVRSCIYDRNLTTYSMPLRIRIGMYQPFLLDWFKRFPRENVFITRLDDYANNRTRVLEKLFEFLGLTKTGTGPLENGSTDYNIKNKSGTSKGLRDGMRLDTRDMIQAFYRSWNQRLADLLQDSRFLWDTNT